MTRNRGVMALAGVALFALGLLGAQYLPDSQARSFELVRTDAAVINSRSDLRGQPYMITFGYTFCPDVCPQTLLYMAGLVDEAQTQLGEVPQPIFVSVDPERDTLERLGQYVGYFHDDIWGLTGEEDALANVARAFSVYFSRVEGNDPENYLVDHSAGILVMDSRHRLVGLVRDGEDVDSALATIAKAL